MQASEFLPLLYYIVGFFWTHLAPVRQPAQIDKYFCLFLVVIKPSEMKIYIHKVILVFIKLVHYEKVELRAIRTRSRDKTKA